MGDVSQCDKCAHLLDCMNRVWQLEQTADGWRPAPLYCQPEHPDYRPDEWRHQRPKAKNGSDIDPLERKVRNAQIVAMCREGLSQRQVAKRFGLSAGTVSMVMAQAGGA